MVCDDDWDEGGDEGGDEACDEGCDEASSGKSKKVSPAPEKVPLSERSSSGGAAPRGAAIFEIGAR